MMSISEEQYERLIGLLTDNRVAITTLGREIGLRLDELERGQQLGFKLLGARCQAIEDDIGKVQSELREVVRVQTEHTQSLVGLTQLCKSGWDLTESLQRHIHGEADEEGQSGAHDEGRNS